MFRARLELGRWPLPMDPDPKDLSFAPMHMTVVMWFVIFSLACLIPWLPLLAFRVQLEPRLRLFPAGLLLALPWLLLIVVCFLDPGDYVAWFLD